MKRDVPASDYRSGHSTRAMLTRALRRQNIASTDLATFHWVWMATRARLENVARADSPISRDQSRPHPKAEDNAIRWQRGNWKAEKRRKLICRVQFCGNRGDRSWKGREREREREREVGRSTDSFHWLWGKASVVNGWQRHLSRQWTPGVYSHVTTSVTRYKYTRLCSLALFGPISHLVASVGKRAFSEAHSRDRLAPARFRCAASHVNDAKRTTPDRRNETNARGEN